MNVGKKHVVISVEEYERLKDNSADFMNPEKRDLKKSANEMKHVWERNIPADEQIRLFTDELNNLKKRYDTLKKPKPLEIVMKNEGVEKEFMVSNIIESLPTTSQRDGLLLINHLKSRPDIIKWNEKGEVIFRGDTLIGSNIIDLISDVLTNRKESKTPLMDKTVFLKALSEINVPYQWIKNKQHKTLLQSYKAIKTNSRVKTPDQKKIKLDGWSSST